MTLTQNQPHYFQSPCHRHPHVPADVQIIEFMEQFLLETVYLHVGRRGERQSSVILSAWGETQAECVLRITRLRLPWEGMPGLLSRSGQQLLCVFSCELCPASLHICWRGRARSLPSTLQCELGVRKSDSSDLTLEILERISYF